MDISEVVIIYKEFKQSLTQAYNIQLKVFYIVI